MVGVLLHQQEITTISAVRAAVLVETVPGVPEVNNSD